MTLRKREFLFALASTVAALPGASQAQAADTGNVLRHYGALVSAAYEDTLATAIDLQSAVRAFIAKPTAVGLAAARKLWLAAREWYGQTEAFRFYGGPFDDD